jgi:hypothetical protein
MFKSKKLRLSLAPGEVEILYLRDCFAISQIKIGTKNGTQL